MAAVGNNLAELIAAYKAKASQGSLASLPAAGIAHDVCKAIGFKGEGNDGTDPASWVHREVEELNGLVWHVADAASKLGDGNPDNDGEAVAELAHIVAGRGTFKGRLAMLTISLAPPLTKAVSAVLSDAPVEEKQSAVSGVKDALNRTLPQFVSTAICAAAKMPKKHQRLQDQIFSDLDFLAYLVKHWQDYVHEALESERRGVRAPGADGDFESSAPDEQRSAAKKKSHKQKGSWKRRFLAHAMKAAISGRRKTSKRVGHSGAGAADKEDTRLRMLAELSREFLDGFLRSGRHNHPLVKISLQLLEAFLAISLTIKRASKFQFDAAGGKEKSIAEGAVAAPGSQEGSTRTLNEQSGPRLPSSKSIGSLARPQDGRTSFFSRPSLFRRTSLPDYKAQTARAAEGEGSLAEGQATSSATLASGEKPAAGILAGVKESIQKFIPTKLLRKATSMMPGSSASSVIEHPDAPEPAVGAQDAFGQAAAAGPQGVLKQPGRCSSEPGLSQAASRLKRQVSFKDYLAHGERADQHVGTDGTAAGHPGGAAAQNILASAPFMTSTMTLPEVFHHEDAGSSSVHEPPAGNTEDPFTSSNRRISLPPAYEALRRRLSKLRQMSVVGDDFPQDGKGRMPQETAECTLAQIAERAVNMLVAREHAGHIPDVSQMVKQVLLDDSAAVEPDRLTAAAAELVTGLNPASSAGPSSSRPLFPSADDQSTTAPAQTAPGASLQQVPADPGVGPASASAEATGSSIAAVRPCGFTPYAPGYCRRIAACWPNLPGPLPPDGTAAAAAAAAAGELTAAGADVPLYPAVKLEPAAGIEAARQEAEALANARKVMTEAPEVSAIPASGSLCVPQNAAANEQAADNFPLEPDGRDCDIRHGAATPTAAEFVTAPVSPADQRHEQASVEARPCGFVRRLPDSGGAQTMEDHRGPMSTSPLPMETNPFDFIDTLGYQNVMAICPSRTAMPEMGASHAGMDFASGTSVPCCPMHAPSGWHWGAAHAHTSNVAASADVPEGCMACSSGSLPYCLAAVPLTGARPPTVPHQPFAANRHASTVKFRMECSVRMFTPWERRDGSLKTLSKPFGKKSRLENGWYRGRIQLRGEHLQILEPKTKRHKAEVREAYLRHAVLEEPRPIRQRDGTIVKRTMGPFIKLWLMNGMLLTMEFDTAEEASVWTTQLKAAIAASSV